MDQEEKLFVVTANPETMMIGVQDQDLDAVLCKPSTVIVPDAVSYTHLPFPGGHRIPLYGMRGNPIHSVFSDTFLYGYAMGDNAAAMH